MSAYPPRDKVERKQTWNAESVFKNYKAWELELKNVLSGLDSVKKYQGRLGDSPAVLFDAMSEYEHLSLRAQHVYMYAGFSFAVDTTDQKAAGMQGKAAGMLGQIAAAFAFIPPELISIGKNKLDEWMEQESKLAKYAHAFDDLFRKQKHVRSGEVEELLGMLLDPFTGPANTTSMLTNADFKFAPAVNANGRKLEVTQSSIHKILEEACRPLPRWKEAHRSWRAAPRSAVRHGWTR